MKKIVLFIIKVLGWPIGMLYGEKFSLYWSLISDAIYCSVVKYRFKSAPNLQTFGHPFELRGGKFFSLGDSVTLGKDARLEAFDHYPYDGGIQHFTPHVTIGEHAVVNPLCHIGCINEIIIGKFVTIGERTLITDHTHGKATVDDMKLAPRKRPLYSKGPIVIEDYVTLGENCIVLAGVTIGHNSIVGANSVVTHSVPPFSVVAGNPAKVLKTVVE